MKRTNKMFPVTWPKPPMRVQMWEHWYYKPRTHIYSRRRWKMWVLRSRRIAVWVQ